MHYTYHACLEKHSIPPTNGRLADDFSFSSQESGCPPRLETLCLLELQNVRLCSKAVLVSTIDYFEYCTGLENVSNVQRKENSFVVRLTSGSYSIIKIHSFKSIPQCQVLPLSNLRVSIHSLSIKSPWTQAVLPYRQDTPFDGCTRTGKNWNGKGNSCPRFRLCPRATFSFGTVISAQIMVH